MGVQENTDENFSEQKSTIVRNLSKDRLILGSPPKISPPANIHSLEFTAKLNFEAEQEPKTPTKPLKTVQSNPSLTKREKNILIRDQSSQTLLNMDHFDEYSDEKNSYSLTETEAISEFPTNASTIVYGR